MDDLNHLSDAELRHRLLQYGFQNMPVTDTTRKILIKKLRSHLNNEKNKMNRKTSYVTRYSSDEEFDEVTKNRGAKGRSTGISSSTKSTNLSSISVPRFRVPASKNTPDANNHSRIYVSPLIRTPDLFTQPNGVSDSTSGITRRSTASTYSPSVNNYYTTPDRTFLNESRHLDTSSRNSSTISNGEQEQFNYSSSTVDSPYTSDFSRRLFNLRNQSIRNSNVQKRDYSTNILNNNRSSLRNDLSELLTNRKGSKTIKERFLNTFNQFYEQYGFKQNLIPCILVGSFFIFLILVAVIYMTITPDLVTTINEKNLIYTKCSPRNSNSKQLITNDISCVDSDTIPMALKLLQKIAPDLQNRAKHHFCKDRLAAMTMSAREVMHYTPETENAFAQRRAFAVLYAAEYLLDKNPHWKISNVDSQGNPINLGDVVELRSTQSNHFAILNPSLPLSCVVYKKMEKLFMIVGTLSIIGLVFGAIVFTYKVIANYRQSKINAINQFVCDVINEVQRKSLEEDGNNFVVLNHLRDKLIPLHMRKQKECYWQKAIEYIEQNESRIQFDVQIRNGENFKVLKWIDSVSTKTEQFDSTSSTSKKWHSPTFDKTNKIASPPTPCLKIRQMFDKFEAENVNLKTTIQDAILEKVGSMCNIYDIQIDKESCCVYVKCANEADAGIVHNKINGWWFDKRLVSIKFLHLKRYLSRFPNSLSGPACLRPSNTKNLSMSKYHETIESNGIEKDDDTDSEN